MLTYRFLLYVGALVLWTGLSRPLIASCPKPLSLEDQVAQSPVVFLGRAIGQQIVTDATGRKAATETMFEIEKMWKGDVKTRTIRVRTCGWSDGREALTCSGEVRFELGSRYVVFTYGDPLWADSCSSTNSVEEASQVLKWLSAHESR